MLIETFRLKRALFVFLAILLLAPAFATAIVSMVNLLPGPRLSSPFWLWEVGPGPKTSSWIDRATMWLFMCYSVGMLYFLPVALFCAVVTGLRGGFGAGTTIVAATITLGAQAALIPAVRETFSWPDALAFHGPNWLLAVAAVLVCGRLLAWLGGIGRLGPPSVHRG